MTMSVRDAREKLARVGIALHRASTSETAATKTFLVTTPVGSDIYLRSDEVVGLVRDIEKRSIPRQALPRNG